MKNSMFGQKTVAFLPEISTPRSLTDRTQKKEPAALFVLLEASKKRIHHDRSKSNMANFEKCFEGNPNLVSKRQIRAQLDTLQQRMSRSAVFNESFSCELADSKALLSELHGLGAKLIE